MVTWQPQTTMLDTRRVGRYYHTAAMQQQCSSAPHNCSTARSYSPSRVAPAVRVRSRWKFRISMAGYLVNNITPYEQLYGVFFNKKLKNVSCESTTDGWLKLNFASCVIRQTRSLGVLVLCSNWNMIVNYISTIWLVVDTLE